MRNWVAIVAVAGVVAGLLLAGGWLLWGGADRGAGGRAAAAGVAPTTSLPRPPDHSTGARPPEPFPRVPADQIDDGSRPGPRVRTGAGGRQLMILLQDNDCAGEQARLLGAYDDRVEVELSYVAKPPPPGTTIGPDGTYGCVGYGPADSNPYAVITLDDPLGTRQVIIHRPFG